MEDLTEGRDNRRPKYRVDGFSTSFEGESNDFVHLKVRLRGKLLCIDISPSNFHNSASTIKEFYKYFEAIKSSNDDTLDDDDAEDNDDLMYDFFDWAVSPFLPVFQNQAQGPQDIGKDKATLQDFLYPETYDCEFGAIDDNVVPGRIERRQMIQEDDVLHNLPDDCVQVVGKFPSVHPSQVELCPKHWEDAPDAPDAQPHRVRVDGQMLFFKSGEISGPQGMMKEMQKCLRIADLGLDLRTSRVYGIVQDDKNPLIGLLLYYIDEVGTLACAVGPDTPRSVKDKWSAQVTGSLMTLHKAGVVWGDAKADNVLIDVHDDAWIVDFGGGHTDGWVDQDKAGTIEGDLQGLANIVDFIFNEDAVHDRSASDDNYD